MAEPNDVSRRDLLANSLRGAAALSVGRFAPITKLMGSNPILGSGEHRYECIHDWLTPPSWIKFGDTHGVAQDAAGRLYVAHTVHDGSTYGDAICVFDKDGKFITSWGDRFRGGAHGLDLRTEHGQEFLYHCDIAHHQVVKTTLDGKVIWELGVPKEPGVYNEKTPYTPTNVAFSPNGDFYVADGYGSNWIHQYDIKGNWIRTFGGPGSEPGKVQQPHGIWVDSRGHEPMVAVADRANHRIQYFSMDGKHISFVTNGMRLPCHFSILHDEMLVPDLQSVLTILDKDNKVVVQLGDGDPSNLRDHPRKDFIPGKFIHPHDAMFLRNGDILVAEWVPIGRVTLLRKLKS